MLLDFLAQAPPPPTLAPVVPAGIDIPTFGGVWTSTDHIIQMWNQNSGIATGAQLFLLAGLVLAGIVVFVRMVKRLNSDDDEQPQKVNVTVKAPTYRRGRRRR